MLRLLLVLLLLPTLAIAQEFPSGADYPRVNGSTSTSLLGYLLTGRALDFDVQLRRMPWMTGQSYGRIELTLPLSYEPAQLSRWRVTSARNEHSGTHKAFLALAQNKTDVILVARPPSKSELAALPQGTSFDVRPFALDAFVFLANVKNPVKGLSSAQLKKIYTAKTRLWREVGGEDLPIMALSRPRDSGSEELMDSLLLKGEKMGQFPPQNRLSEMGETIERVALNRNAIGYSVFYFERFMMPDARNKLLAVDGIAPTPASIASKTYPFTAPVFCVTRAGIQANSKAARLRDWLLSKEGQKLVAQSGYVPLADGS